MATDADFAAFVLEQSAGAGPVSVRKMFGEYALYCDGKVVALLCDNRFFVKPLPEALALVPVPVMAPPYPGAKPHLVLDEWLDDAEAVARIVATVAAALPAPKPKVRRGRRP